jgi:hypothetical protein
MSWITIVCSMDGVLCFMLAGMYLVVSLEQLERCGHLLFSCSVVAAGANGYGPTRGLGCGISNFRLAPAEVFVTVTKIGQRDREIR